MAGGRRVWKEETRRAWRTGGSEARRTRTTEDGREAERGGRGDAEMPFREEGDRSTEIIDDDEDDDDDG